MFRPTPPGTLSSAVLPRESAANQLLLVIGGSILLALSAQVSLNLPFTPVPVTGQTFAVLLLGALLGSRLGGAAVFAYLTEGAMGLPVFANHMGGIGAFTRPSGGYLFGFFVAAVVVGWFAERGWDRSRWIVLPLLLGNALIYVPGLLWLRYYVGWDRLLDAGLWPFVPGDLAKLVAVTLALPAGWEFLERFKGR